ncbi:aromatic compound dioxygenase [Mycena floridula]|nr:aromatic compound dioxygenase [Mycena floridula]
MILTLRIVLALAGLATSVFSHGAGEPAPANWKLDNLMARESLQSRCNDHLTARKEKRISDALESAASRRPFYKRDILTRSSFSNDGHGLLTPEVTQGPYHILGELVRQNITEDQVGIPLQVLVDFIDISTCRPVQVWVDAWHANATGFYGGYIAETGGSAGPFPGPPSSSGSATSTTSKLTATSGADTPDVVSFLDLAPEDNSTFLRGIYQTDKKGRLNIYSIFPGWYPGRAQHFHIKVYPQGHIAKNGSFVPRGNAVHTGQFFFDKHTLDAVAATSIYSANALPWTNKTTNEADMWYPFASVGPYNANMDIAWVGHDIFDGLIGSISVGLNMSYSSFEVSTHWAEFDVEGLKLDYEN